MWNPSIIYIYIEVQVDLKRSTWRPNKKKTSDTNALDTFRFAHHYISVYSALHGLVIAVYFSIENLNFVKELFLTTFQNVTLIKAPIYKLNNEIVRYIFKIVALVISFR